MDSDVDLDICIPENIQDVMNGHEKHEYEELRWKAGMNSLQRKIQTVV